MDKNDPNPVANNWNEYKRLVMAELGRLAEAVRKVESKVDLTRQDIATLKVKAGMWGALAGVVPATIALLWTVFSK